MKVEIPGINLVAERIPLRKNSKLLKDKPSVDQAAKAVVGNTHLHIPEGPSCSTAAPLNAGQHVAANVPQEVSFGIDRCDPEEVALHAKFKADLWQLRATKQGLLATRPPHTNQAPVALKRAADGSFVVSQASTVEPGAAGHTGHIGYEPKKNNLDQAVDGKEAAGHEAAGHEAAGHEAAVEPFPKQH